MLLRWPLQRFLCVPGQQRFERLHGISSRQILKDVVQIRIRLKAVGAGGAHEREQIRAGTCAERIVREEPNSTLMDILL